jgi:predicted membrane channel-forming protein YqfA (hemolysin III family)
MSTTGIILFVFIETNDNYWYIHSLWHICIATSIVFFLPPKISKKIL